MNAYVYKELHAFTRPNQFLRNLIIAFHDSLSNENNIKGIFALLPLSVGTGCFFELDQLSITCNLWNLIYISIESDSLRNLDMLP